MLSIGKSAGLVDSELGCAVAVTTRPAMRIDGTSNPKRGTDSPAGAAAAPIYTLSVFWGVHYFLRRG